MTDQVTVPWDQATVDGLNRYQIEGRFHPYTCPNRGDGNHTNREERGGDLGALLATPSGWICGECDYTQNWAHQASATISDTCDMCGSTNGLPHEPSCFRAIVAAAKAKRE